MLEMIEHLLPEGWAIGGVANDLLICPCGHTIEQDGVCPNGHESPLMTLGLI